MLKALLTAGLFSCYLLLMKSYKDFITCRFYSG
jgi:hypothetical protein